MIIVISYRPVLNLLPKLSLTPAQPTVIGSDQQSLSAGQTYTILNLPPPSYEEHLQQTVQREDRAYQPTPNSAFVFLCSQQQAVYEDMAREGNKYFC